ncbi:MAG: hypothetical protein ACOYM8_14480, partial [Caulobacterales bacterium]
MDYSTIFATTPAPTRMRLGASWISQSRRLTDLFHDLRDDAGAAQDALLRILDFAKSAPDRPIPRSS